MKFPSVLKAACVVWILAGWISAFCAERVLEAEMHHLRGGGDTQEWEDFPAEAEGDSLTVRFEAEANEDWQSLWLRQRNVQWSWGLLLNGKPLGMLREDEQGQRLPCPVPPGRLQTGENVLRVVYIEGQRPDDIWVGDIRLDPRPPMEVLGERLVEVVVNEEPIPCRLTLVDAEGDLVQMGTSGGKTRAVRPGVVYSLTGREVLLMPAMEGLRLIASRGFEYGIDSQPVGPGITNLTLTIERQVHFEGTAIDPHVHTLSYSKHGSCRLHERVITVAAEGIDAVAATEHNQNIDYAPMARNLDVTHFVTIVGNEYTTRTGHFNLLGVDPDANPPSFIGPIWKGVERGCKSAKAPVVILNHARDMQTNFRPFDPANHQGALGRRLDGGSYDFFNGLEVVVSGATQTDPFELMRDWFALLNAGHRVGAIGSSDSHDVSRYIVGQARTYVKGAGRFDLARFAEALPAGDTHVAAGFLVELELENGEPTVRLQYPDWIEHRKTTLYRNGESIPIERLPPGTEDFWLVAVAEGPGVNSPHWPFARPFRPDGPAFRPTAMGISNLIRVDADGDGVFRSSREVAERLLGEGEPAAVDQAVLWKAAGSLSPAVATHLAGLLAAGDVEVAVDLGSAPENVRIGVERFREAEADCEAARER